MDFREYEDRGSRTRRPTLGVRDMGVERLIADLPFEFGGDDRDELRGWALALKRSASAFQIEQAKRRGGRRD